MTKRKAKSILEDLLREINCDEQDIDISPEDFTEAILLAIDTLNSLEVEKSMSVAYVVTRCEEHSDYVEKVFFDEEKAQKYCNSFAGNENEYTRHITKVEVE